MKFLGRRCFFFFFFNFRKSELLACLALAWGVPIWAEVPLVTHNALFSDTVFVLPSSIYFWHFSTYKFASRTVASRPFELRSLSLISKVMITSTFKVMSFYFKVISLKVSMWHHYKFQSDTTFKGLKVISLNSNVIFLIINRRMTPLDVLYYLFVKQIHVISLNF